MVPRACPASANSAATGIADSECAGTETLLDVSSAPLAPRTRTFTPVTAASVPFNSSSVADDPPVLSNGTTCTADDTCHPGSLTSTAWFAPILVRTTTLAAKGCADAISAHTCTASPAGDVSSTRRPPAGTVSAYSVTAPTPSSGASTGLPLASQNASENGAAAVEVLTMVIAVLTPAPAATYGILLFPPPTAESAPALGHVIACRV